MNISVTLYILIRLLQKKKNTRQTIYNLHNIDDRNIFSSTIIFPKKEFITEFKLESRNLVIYCTNDGPST